MVIVGMSGGLKEWRRRGGFEGGNLVLGVFVADVLECLLVCFDVHLLQNYNTIFINLSS